MYTNFTQLSPDARLWVYQANRSLTEPEIQYVRATLQEALSTWAAHGQPLLASADVVESRFVLIGVDEDQALPSGCSIDASVHMVQAIGQELGIDFLDRAVAFRGVSNVVETLPLTSLKAAVAEGRLTPTTPVFNTLVKTKAEFEAEWLKPAADTWLKRYFKTALA